MSECRAFIVDDEPDIVALVALQLEMANHGLVVAGTAASGEEAVRGVAEARPNVVVLDYLMPDSNGLNVATQILAEEPNQSIVLFSSYLSATVESEARRIGIRECVQKDRIKELPEIVRKYCTAA